MHHIMIDLETWGVRPGCAIRSIGAVEFEVDGRTGDSFYRNVDQRSCEVIGLTIDPETRDWWARQPSDVQAILNKNPEPIRKVAREFYDWFRSCGPADRTRVWAHGASFDPPIWQKAVESGGGAVPWSYFNIRDTRTLYDMVMLDVRDMARDGQAHSALDDCLFQVRCVAAAYQRFDLKSKAYLETVTRRPEPAAPDVFG